MGARHSAVGGKHRQESPTNVKAQVGIAGICAVAAAALVSIAAGGALVQTGDINIGNSTTTTTVNTPSTVLPQTSESTFVHEARDTALVGPGIAIRDHTE